MKAWIVKSSIIDGYWCEGRKVGWFESKKTASRFNEKYAKVRAMELDAEAIELDEELKDD